MAMDNVTTRFSVTPLPIAMSINLRIKVIVLEQYLHAQQPAVFGEHQVQLLRRNTCTMHTFSEQQFHFHPHPLPKRFAAIGHPAAKCLP